MKKTRGFTIVSTLITITIMLVLAVALMKGSGMFAGPGEKVSARKDGKGTTTMGAAMYAAKDDVCRSNLGQVRQSLMVLQSSSGEDSYPQDIHETKLPSDFYKCPVGHEDYEYDPSTGKVRCPHPGHENY